MAVSITTCLLAAAPRETQADNFTTLTGTLVTQQVPCATLCTHGTLSGGLAGELDFTMFNMTPTNDPNVFNYRGQIIVSTATGTLTGPIDFGTWNIATGEFTDHTIFTTGTGSFSGVTGSMVIAGTFDPTLGGHSDYIARLNGL